MHKLAPKYLKMCIASSLVITVALRIDKPQKTDCDSSHSLLPGTSPHVRKYSVPGLYLEQIISPGAAAQLGRKQNLPPFHAPACPLSTHLCRSGSSSPTEAVLFPFC